MRIEQINKTGGVLGKKIKVQWIDTKSDKPTAATNAEELIAKGAVAIIATCDFDFSFPAINAAQGAQGAGHRAVCVVAEGRHAGDRRRLRRLDGPRLRRRGRHDGGVDAGGEAAVEDARTSSRTRRSSTRRRRPTTSRLAGRSSAARSAARTPSSEARTSTSARRSLACGARSASCDMIFDGSWQPYGSQLIRAIRDAGIANADHDERVGQRHARQPGRRARSRTSGRWASPACRRTAQGTQTPQVRTIATQFKAKYGQPLGNHYALPGYALADALVGGDQEGRLDRRHEDRGRAVRRSRSRSTTSAT